MIKPYKKHQNISDYFYGSNIKYLDKNIRLGLGARGSAFIFKKTNDKKAENWKIDIQRKPLNAKMLGFSLIFLGVTVFNLFSSIDVRAFQFLKNGFATFFVLFGSIFAFTNLITINSFLSF